MSQPLNSLPHISKADTLSLNAFESLLTEAHLELVEPAVHLEPVALLGQPEVSVSPVIEVKSPTKELERSEIRLILDLMNQVDSVNELLVETSNKLQRAHDKLLSMEREISQQEIRIDRMSEFEQKYVETKAWLDATLNENAMLKRPWWKKLLQKF
jgi:hypothetical protein